MLKITLCCVAPLLLAACETPYQEMGALGGVSATRITADTVQITAAGNAYTDADTIQRYALRRAAEETLADGFDLFRIASSADRTQVGVATSTYATATRYGAFGLGFSTPIIKPGQTILIRMLKGPKPRSMPDGEFDAHEIMNFMGSSDGYSDHRDCSPGPDGRIVCR